MTSRPVVVKLGGSVITDKAHLRTLREDHLQRLAGELAQVQGPLVVVHGAGSYGHVRARKHQVDEGTAGPATSRDASQVRLDVAELHGHVNQVLHDAGLAPAGIPGGALMELREGELGSFHAASIPTLLEHGFTPVTHGDVAPDTTRGFGIVSGDVLVEQLTRVLHPRLVVFATDVPGVLDADDAPIPHLTPDDALDLTTATGSTHPDVTGGMAGKLRHMAGIARGGTPVRVVDGTTAGTVLGATTGTPLTGTLLSAGGDHA